MVPGPKVAGGIKRVFDNPQSIPKSGLWWSKSLWPRCSWNRRRPSCLTLRQGRSGAVARTAATLTPPEDVKHLPRQGRGRVSRRCGARVGLGSAFVMVRS